MALGDCGGEINVAKQETREGYSIYQGPKIVIVEGEDTAEQISKWLETAKVKKLSTTYLNGLKNIEIMYVRVILLYMSINHFYLIL